MVSFLLALAMAVALAVAAFCAGSETAFLSVSRGRLLHLAREGSAAAKIVKAAIDDMTATMTSLLVGNNLAAVVFSSASAALSARLFASSAVARTVWSVTAAFTVLYLSEFLPKLLCSTRPLRRILALARPYRVFAFVMAPLTAVATAITSLAVGRARRTDAPPPVTVHDLLRILEDRKNGVRLTDFESALISRILVLRRKGQPVTPEALLRALDDED
jgi:CBS domain containing-hemolysin-like protein